jgi:SAM-dependent methyltransferase
MRRLLKSLFYAWSLRPLTGPFERDAGHCWTARLPQRLAGSAGSSSGSPLLLFEDGQYLGPAHASLQFVRRVGRGWYSHQGDRLYFSTPDNTDPNRNGRTYSVSTSRLLNRRRSGAPTNLRHRDASDAAFERDLEYALHGMKYVDVARDAGIESLKGLSVLEIGPGTNYAWALLLACLGAKVFVVDAFLSPWDPQYHPRFYRLLRERLPVEDSSALEALIDAGSFTEKVITRLESPAEEIDLPDESIDVVFSNAVAEHFYDVPAAFRQLSRVTRPGGFGFHWVDFRDHRDFERPLEYLLMPEAEFKHQFGLHRGELGNRLRRSEMARMIEDAGFQIAHCNITRCENQPYLDDFFERLRQSPESPYRDMAREDVAETGALFVLQKPG